MIIWINGTFGVGKTTTTAALLPLLQSARAFDPEEVGYMLLRLLPDLTMDDFQDHAAWRPLVAASAAQVATQTGSTLVCPQTVLVRSHWDEIRSAFLATGQSLVHVLLDCDDAVLARRIEEDEEAREWRLDHLERFARSREWLRASADLTLDTTSCPPASVARAITDHLGPHAGLSSSYG